MYRAFAHLNRVLVLAVECVLIVTLVIEKDSEHSFLGVRTFDDARPKFVINLIKTALDYNLKQTVSGCLKQRNLTKVFGCSKYGSAGPATA